MIYGNIETLINTKNCLIIDYMGDEEIDNIEEVSKMFSNNKNLSDEELALHIIQKFNIDMDTIETMPAFQEKIKPLFGIEKEK